MCCILSLSYLFSTIVPWHLLDCGNQLYPVPFIPLPHITIGFMNVSLDSRRHLSVSPLYSLRLLRHLGLWQPSWPVVSYHVRFSLVSDSTQLECGTQLYLLSSIRSCSLFTLCAGIHYSFLHSANCTLASHILRLCVNYSFSSVSSLSTFHGWLPRFYSIVFQFCLPHPTSTWM
jgi:hypothetical protein